MYKYILRKQGFHARYRQVCITLIEQCNMIQSYGFYSAFATSTILIFECIYTIQFYVIKKAQECSIIETYSCLKIAFAMRVVSRSALKMEKQSKKNARLLDPPGLLKNAVLEKCDLEWSTFRYTCSPLQCMDPLKVLKKGGVLLLKKIWIFLQKQRLPIFHFFY